MSDKKNSNNISINNGAFLSVDQSLQMSTEIFDKLLDESDIEKALKSLEPYVERSLYHCASKAGYLAIVALFTFDKEDIANALQALDELSKLCNKFRNTGFIQTLIKMIKTPNYEKFTDLQAHAELIHCMSIALSAGICAINTYNVYGLIKIVYRLNRFIKHFRYVKQLFRTKKVWESDASRQSYEGLQRLANGVAHLVISTIPPKILKVVNFLGYVGIESKGWDEINKVAFQYQGISGQLGRLGLIIYWSYAEPHGFIGAEHLEDLDTVIRKELDKYPNSHLLRGFKAKKEQLHGRIDNAITMYKALLEEGASLSCVPYQMELMFSYALKSEWTECVKYAKLVSDQSQHTPACATYAEAVFKYVLSQDTNDSQLKSEASELFKMVPTQRIRHFGKTMTPEKVAVVNSEKYFKNNEFLILPEVEFLYQYNYLIFIRTDPSLLDKFMARIDSQIDKYKVDIEGSDYLDNYLSALFNKGFIHKLKGEYNEAIECFQQILDNESRIGAEFSIPPKAVLELGLTRMESNDWESAIEWLNKCIDDYSGYLYENYVHLRACGGLRSMGVAINKTVGNTDGTKLKEYKKEWLKEIDVDNINYEKIVKEEDENANVLN